MLWIKSYLPWFSVSVSNVFLLSSLSCDLLFIMFLSLVTLLETPHSLSVWLPSCSGSDNIWCWWWSETMCCWPGTRSDTGHGTEWWAVSCSGVSHWSLANIAISSSTTPLTTTHNICNIFARDSQHPSLLAHWKIVF